MANELLNQYVATAGRNRGFDRFERKDQMRIAKEEYKNEIARQEKIRKDAEEKQRREWWKALIPGAAGLVGAGLGAALGPAGSMAAPMIGMAAGNMLGSGYAASQGVPGAAGQFNQMSPMLMYAMMNAMQPQQLGQGDAFGTGQADSYLDAEMNNAYGRGNWRTY